jgi:DnaK suppressor protein
MEATPAKRIEFVDLPRERTYNTAPFCGARRPGDPKAVQMTASGREEELTQVDLEEIESLLVDMRVRLKGDVSQMEDETFRDHAESHSSVDHMADHGSENFDTDQTIGIIERGSDVLFEIDEALARMKSGAFGLCETCPATIGRARLRAMPYARLCLDCQMDQERT